MLETTRVYLHRCSVGFGAKALPDRLRLDLPLILGHNSRVLVAIVWGEALHVRTGGNAGSN